eukprot:m.496927 g.496927  ORF g.496927 m.496927 type:complete len:965 (-) comp57307_c1_seq24:1750-4644(-)
MARHRRFVYKKRLFAVCNPKPNISEKARSLLPKCSRFWSKPLNWRLRQALFAESAAKSALQEEQTQKIQLRNKSSDIERVIAELQHQLHLQKMQQASFDEEKAKLIAHFHQLENEARAQNQTRTHVEQQLQVSSLENHRLAELLNEKVSQVEGLVAHVYDLRRQLEVRQALDHHGRSPTSGSHIPQRSSRSSPIYQQPVKLSATSSPDSPNLENADSASHFCSLLKQTMSQLDTANSAITTLDAQNRSLSSKLTLAEARCRDFARQLESPPTKREEPPQKGAQDINVATAVQHLAQGRIASLEKGNRQILTDNETLAQEVKGLKSDRSALQESVSQLQMSLTQLQSREAELVQQLANFRAEMESSRGETSSLKVKYALLQTQARSQQSAHASLLEKEIDDRRQLEASIEALQLASQKSADTEHALKEEGEQQKETIATLQRKIKALQSEKGTILDTLDSLNQLYQSDQVHLQDLMRSNADLDQQYSSLLSEMKLLSSQQQASASVINSIETVRSTSERLRSEVAEVREQKALQVSQLAAQSEELKEINSTLAQQIQVQHQEKLQLSLSLEQQRAREQQLVQSTAGIQQHLETAYQDIQTLQTALRDRETMLSSLEQKNQQLAETHHSALSHIERLEATCRSLEADMRARQIRHAENARVTEQAHAENLAEYDRQMHRLETQLASLKVESAEHITRSDRLGDFFRRYHDHVHQQNARFREVVSITESLYPSLSGSSRPDDGLPLARTRDLHDDDDSSDDLITSFLQLHARFEETLTRVCSFCQLSMQRLQAYQQHQQLQRQAGQPKQQSQQAVEEVQEARTQLQVARGARSQSQSKRRNCTVANPIAADNGATSRSTRAASQPYSATSRSKDRLCWSERRTQNSVAAHDSKNAGCTLCPTDSLTRVVDQPSCLGARQAPVATSANSGSVSCGGTSGIFSRTKPGVATAQRALAAYDSSARTSIGP